MALPPFEASGNLPAGVHSATWDEFRDRYGGNERRRTLLAGLKAALDSLKEADCQTAWVDGSFVTAKEEPNDFDACWEPNDDLDVEVLDPALLDFSHLRRAQKARFGGDLFVADEIAASREGDAPITFLEFFQRTRETGQTKGIVVLDLGSMG